MKVVFLADPWRPDPPPTACQRVVTPNPQAARRLGVPFLSLEALARRALPPGLVAAPLLAVARAHRKILAEAGDPDPVGTAHATSGALSALLRSGADLKKLQKLGGRLAQRAAEALALSEKLLSQNLVHPAELLHYAARHVEPRPLYVFGYPHLGFDQQAFLKKAAADPSTAVLPYPRAPFAEVSRVATKALEEDGWEVKTREEEPQTTGERAARRFAGEGEDPPAQVFAHSDPEAEIRWALAEIKALLLRGVPGHRIALVTRDDAALGPLALAIAWEYGVPLRALYAVPLAETRLGGWVATLLEAADEGYPFEATVRLLASPLGPGLPPAAWQEARKKHPNGKEAWRALGAPEALFALPRRARRRELVQALRGVLEGLHVRRRTFPWPREVLAYHALLDGLTALPDPEEPLDLGAFRAEVSELLLTETVPAAPGRGGVELHTPLSLGGAEFDHLFVVELSEGRFPPPVHDDPALDFFERARAAKKGFPIELPKEAAFREALQFFALLSGAKARVALSYNHQDGEKSPYLAPFKSGAPPEPVAASLEEVRAYRLRRREAWEDDPVLPRAFLAWEVELRREGPKPPDPYDGFTKIPVDPTARVFAVTELEALGQCPFKWFARSVLKLAEPEEAAEELAPDLRGRLYHDTLARAVRLGESPGTAKDRLEEAFAEVEAELDLFRFPYWRGERLEHLAVLKRLVSSEVFFDEDAVILAVEENFKATWEGFMVKGRVDRADRLENGVHLYDYKSGKSRPPGVKDEEGKLKIDFQLPLYLLAAAPALYPDLNPETAYYLLVRGLERKGLKKEHLDALPQVAERLRQNLEEGDFRVQPDVKQEACKYCPFDLVCRRGPRLERKGGDRGAH